MLIINNLIMKEASPWSSCPRLQAGSQSARCQTQVRRWTNWHWYNTWHVYWWQRKFVFVIRLFQCPVFTLYVRWPLLMSHGHCWARGKQKFHQGLNRSDFKVESMVYQFYHQINIESFIAIFLSFCSAFRSGGKRVIYRRYAAPLNKKKFWKKCFFGYMRKF